MSAFSVQLDDRQYREVLDCLTAIGVPEKFRKVMQGAADRTATTLNNNVARAVAKLTVLNVADVKEKCHILPQTSGDSVGVILRYEDRPMNLMRFVTSMAPQKGGGGQVKARIYRGRRAATFVSSFVRTPRRRNAALLVFQRARRTTDVAVKAQIWKLQKARRTAPGSAANDKLRRQVQALYAGKAAAVKRAKKQSGRVGRYPIDAFHAPSIVGLIGDGSAQQIAQAQMTAIWPVYLKNVKSKISWAMGLPLADVPFGD